ncbi:uncharacterized protein METZ01_LOCUS359999 [marine metagenome]|uniref:Uncharacterized protein n=1 Tax=marine metagenome TaxID=408172 RepID=A0A382SCG1_9ZZZZ
MSRFLYKAHHNGDSMRCNKCIKGIIMKQIAIAEFIPMQCECVVEQWFEDVKRRG